MRIRLCEIRNIINRVMCENSDDEDSIFNAIEKIFVQEVVRIANGTYAGRTAKSQPHWITLQFFNIDKNYTEQTISIGLKNGDLQLTDVYVPESLRGKGFLTNFLSKIRHVQGLTGNLRVNVGMNQQGWKTIVARSGFVWS